MTFDPGRVHAEAAKHTELAVVAWPYARGSSSSTDGEPAIDVAGRRIILFSGGPANFGSIIGGNPFQRPKEEVVRMPGAPMDTQSAVPTRDRAQ
jgi:hypothetical protein